MMLGLLIIAAFLMRIYIAANGRRITILKKEIRLLEQKQVQRLDRSGLIVTTNAPPGTLPPAAAK